MLYFNKKLKKIFRYNKTGEKITDSLGETSWGKKQPRSFTVKKAKVMSHV